MRLAPLAQPSFPQTTNAPLAAAAAKQAALRPTKLQVDMPPIPFSGAPSPSPVAPNNPSTASPGAPPLKAEPGEKETEMDIRTAASLYVQQQLRMNGLTTAGSAPTPGAYELAEPQAREYPENVAGTPHMDHGNYPHQGGAPAHSSGGYIQNNHHIPGIPQVHGASRFAHMDNQQRYQHAQSGNTGSPAHCCWPEDDGMSDGFDLTDILGHCKGDLDAWIAGAEGTGEHAGHHNMPGTFSHAGSSAMGVNQGGSQRLHHGMPHPGEHPEEGGVHGGYYHMPGRMSVMGQHDPVAPHGIVSPFGAIQGLHNGSSMYGVNGHQMAAPPLPPHMHDALGGPLHDGMELMPVSPYNTEVPTAMHHGIMGPPGPLVKDDIQVHLYDSPAISSSQPQPPHAASPQSNKRSYNQLTAAAGQTSTSVGASVHDSHAPVGASVHDSHAPDSKVGPVMMITEGGSSDDADHSAVMLNPHMGGKRPAGPGGKTHHAGSPHMLRDGGAEKHHDGPTCSETESGVSLSDFDALRDLSDSHWEQLLEAIPHMDWPGA
eukprot:jgi/Chrzof1/5668/Cz16g11020.t1